VRSFIETSALIACPRESGSARMRMIENAELCPFASSG
jgi:hypothetical protein